MLREVERIQRADAAWLAERIEFESRPDSLIEVPELTRHWDPLIRVYRDRLEAAAKEMRASREATERYEKAPASRRAPAFIKETWKWQSSKDRGQRLWDSHKPIAFRVSLGTYARAVAIANALALAARVRGFSVRDGGDLGRVVFVGHEAEIQMRMTEQLEKKHRPRVGYDGKTEQESYMVPTGRLRISLQTGYPEGPTFEDQGTKELESMLNPVFVAMYRLVVKCWVWERAQQEARRRAEEAERQRAVERQIREEQERKAAAERNRRQPEAFALQLCLAGIQIVDVQMERSSKLRERGAELLGMVQMLEHLPLFLGQYIHLHRPPPSILHRAPSSSLFTTAGRGPAHMLTDKLKPVTEERLEPWLQGEMHSPKGIQMLTRRLLSLYGGSVSLETARSLGGQLMGSSSSRAVKGIVRADLYSNWRAREP